jgi:hypothetical protein
VGSTSGASLGGRRGCGEAECDGIELQPIWTVTLLQHDSGDEREATSRRSPRFSRSFTASKPTSTRLFD